MISRPFPRPLSKTFGGNFVIRFGDAFNVTAFNEVHQDWQAANIEIAKEAFKEGKRELKNEKEGEPEDGTPPSANLSTM